MENYDFAIIGAGGTGLAAAMYAARLELKTVVFGNSQGSELPIGGLITTTHIVENYPGFKNISGIELAKKIEEHARNYPLVNIRQELVESIEKNKDCFLIKTKKGDYSSQAILFATGRKLRKLDVSGSKEFENRGVGYCSLCDGPLYKNKTVAVVGGSDAATIEALILCEYAKKVYIIYRGEKIRAEGANLEKINKNKKITVINNTNITEIRGKDFVTSVILDKPYKGKKELFLDGVYVAIGSDPCTKLAEKLGVKLNNKKEIIINHENSETNLEGIYAAGDAANKSFKQLIIGVAEGCTAAHSAYEYISKKKLKMCEKSSK